MLCADQDYVSIGDVRAAISRGDTTAKAVAYDYIQATRKHNNELNAYTAINERALDDAEILDTNDEQQRGPLHGVPIAVKDSIETAGLRTAFGSKACKDYVPKRDATVVRRLKEAGAVITGKTTCPDWCAGYLSISTLSEVSKNPHDLSRDPGGSSSGSGAAVAARLAIAAIGTDTTGSTRVPAALNGLVGVTPTPGRVSKDCVSPLITVQDSPGPMASSVRDCAIILDTIIGYDPRDDITSINFTNPLKSSLVSAIANPTLQKKRIGVLRDLFGSHPGINTLLNTTLETLKSAGAELIELEIPSLDSFRTNTITSEPVKSDINAFLAARKELSHLTFKDLPYHELSVFMKLINRGPDDVSQSPHYARALDSVRQMRNRMGAVYADNQLDGIVFPTVQCLAPKHEDMFSEKVTSLSFPANTNISSLLQWPAMSIPIGKTRDGPEDPDSPELPVGLDLLGLPLREDDMMALGAGIEAAVQAAATKEKV